MKDIIEIDLNELSESDLDTMDAKFVRKVKVKLALIGFVSIVAYGCVVGVVYYFFPTRLVEKVLTWVGVGISMSIGYDSGEVLKKLDEMEKAREKGRLERIKRLTESDISKLDPLSLEEIAKSNLAELEETHKELDRLAERNLACMFFWLAVALGSGSIVVYHFSPTRLTGQVLVIVSVVVMAMFCSWAGKEVRKFRRNGQ